MRTEIFTTVNIDDLVAIEVWGHALTAKLVAQLVPLSVSDDVLFSAMRRFPSVITENLERIVEEILRERAWRS